MTWIDHEAADFHFLHNHTVVALRPNPNGRFGLMARKQDGREQVWVFDNPEVVNDGTSTWIDDEDLRAFHGNKTQWRELKRWLRERGFTVVNGGIGHIPFSNGRRKYTTGSDGKPRAEYADHEWQYRRPDDPRMAIEAFLTWEEEEAKLDDPLSQMPDRATHMAYR